MRALSIFATTLVLLTAVSSALAQSAPPSSTPSPASKAANLLRVHFHTPNDAVEAQLYMRHQDGYRLVCAAPCKADLPPGAELRAVLADHDDEPHDFVLSNDRGEDVDIEAKRGGRGALAGGIVMTSIGGLTALVGLALALVSTSDSVHDRSSLTMAGVTCLALGGGLTAGGILVIVNRSYEPRIRQKASASSESRASLFASDTNDKTRSLGPWALPAVTSAPVFGLTF